MGENIERANKSKNICFLYWESTFCFKIQYDPHWSISCFTYDINSWIMLYDRFKWALSPWTVFLTDLRSICWKCDEILSLKMISKEHNILFQKMKNYLKSMVLAFPQQVFGPYFFQHIIKITYPISMEVNH